MIKITFSRLKGIVHLKKIGLSKRNSQIKLIVTLMIFSCFGCGGMKFDKEKWNHRDDPGFPPQDRPYMLKDLMKNHKLVGMTVRQAIDFIGDPGYLEDGEISYLIEEDYGTDIDPVYTKYLILTFSKDSIVTNIATKEYKK